MFSFSYCVRKIYVKRNSQKKMRQQKTTFICSKTTLFFNLSECSTVYVRDNLHDIDMKYTKASGGEQ
jgi:hypothetical protein